MIPHAIELNALKNVAAARTGRHLGVVKYVRFLRKDNGHDGGNEDGVEEHRCSAPRENICALMGDRVWVEEAEVGGCGCIRGFRLLSISPSPGSQAPFLPASSTTQSFSIAILTILYILYTNNQQRHSL